MVAILAVATFTGLTVYGNETRSMEVHALSRNLPRNTDYCIFGEWAGLWYKGVYGSKCWLTLLCCDPVGKLPLTGCVCWDGVLMQVCPKSFLMYVQHLPFPGGSCMYVY